MSRFIVFLCLSLALFSGCAQAQQLSALARVRAEVSRVVDTGDSVDIQLGLTQGVPYRIFTLVEPFRLVVDFNEVNWAGFDPKAFNQADSVLDVQIGTLEPGWSRMVLVLAQPLVLDTAVLTSDADQGPVVKLSLFPTTAEAFAATAVITDNDVDTAASSPVNVTVDDTLVVVLDPGHGGIDPGAEAQDAIEADLMLTFARELQALLRRNENVRVVLTREADVFVPLEARVSIARQAGADVFLSLHADALLEGRASGATIYTLSDKASDLASQKLAERHDRADLLAGVDLNNQDDVIAGVLMDMARVETTHRTDRLADSLVAGLSETVGMHKRARLTAGFSVLKAPDIPSVLVELGFLSSPKDRARLLDPEWRIKAAEGILSGILAWAADDAAQAELLRR